MEKTYLKIAGIEFKKDCLIDNVVYQLAPSQVTPSLEIVKNAERSLDGTMCVDITAVKHKVQVIFDLMENDAFEFLMDLIGADPPAVTDPEDRAAINPDGIVVEYFDYRKKQKQDAFRYYLDNITFTPYIVGDDVKWQSVTVDFVQI